VNTSVNALDSAQFEFVPDILKSSDRAASIRGRCLVSALHSCASIHFDSRKVSRFDTTFVCFDSRKVSRFETTFEEGVSFRHYIRVLRFKEGISFWDYIRVLRFMEGVLFWV
jgi:tRNA(His) 5'-end guanylyltransferase